MAEGCSFATRAGYAGQGQDMSFCKSNTAAAMAVRAACGRIIIKDNTPTPARANIDGVQDSE